MQVNGLGRLKDSENKRTREGRKANEATNREEERAEISLLAT